MDSLDNFYMFMFYNRTCTNNLDSNCLCSVFSFFRLISFYLVYLQAHGHSSNVYIANLKRKTINIWLSQYYTPKYFGTQNKAELCFICTGKHCFLHIKDLP